MIEAFEDAVGMPVEKVAALPSARQTANRLAQPLVCATALASFATLRERLPEPLVAAGYSVGELAAYGCAGWLAAEETIRLAVRRAELMDAAFGEPMAMGALRGPAEEIDALLGGSEIYEAIRNGADRVVVAGRAAPVHAVLEEAEARGVKATPLPVTVASHTPLMGPAVAPFRDVLEGSAFRPGGTRVLAGIDGTPVLTRERAVATLSRQLAEPVRWANCMEGLVESGATVALELPAGSDLTRMLRDRNEDLQVQAVAEFTTRAGLLQWVERRLSS